MRHGIAVLGLALALAGCSLELSDDPVRFDEQRFDRARAAASRAAVEEGLVAPGVDIETGAASMDQPCAAVEVRPAGKAAPFLVVVRADGDGLDDRWHFVASSPNLDAAVVDSTRPRCGF